MAQSPSAAPQPGRSMAGSLLKTTAAVLYLCYCLHTGKPALLHGSKCGFPRVQNILDRSLRIVGGSEALYGSHPWLVSLRSRGSHFCGAAVLSDRWLLTAAHCFSSASEDFLRNVKAVVGEYDQRVPDEAEKNFSVKTIRIHEKYRRTSPMSYDIALLELDGRIRFSEHVQPACLPLPRESFPSRTTCVVSGWGRMKERGRLPAVLREVQLALVDQAQCRHALQPLRPAQQVLTVLCAGPERGGRDACQGDSGGPLICPRQDGHWAVVGVTSWGKGCGRGWINNSIKPPSRRGSPGVFTDVRMFLPWIKANLKEDTNSSQKSLSRLCSVTDGAFTSSEDLIRNPELPGHGYHNNEMCSWSISVPTGKNILLEFLEFDVENDTLCHSDQLTVFVGEDMPIGRFCGSQIPAPMLIGSQHVTVQFVSDVTDSGAGFSIQFRAVEEDYVHGPACGTVALVQTQGAVQTPRYPEPYSNGSRCRWVILAPAEHVVKLDFDDFDLEQSEDCKYDSLTVLGDVAGREEIVVLCGQRLPPPVLSYSSVMVLQFSADSSVTGRGFRASVSFISQTDLQEEESIDLEEDRPDGTSTRQLRAAACGMPHALAGSGPGGVEGAEGTSPHLWPWHVRLSLATERVCGGAIIQPAWILTAAHCVHDLEEKLFHLLTVVAGGPELQSRGVRRVLLHPRFEHSSLDSDVALLQLDSALTLSQHIQPVCLPPAGQEVPPHQACAAAVWSSQMGAAWTITPQQMEASVIARAECEQHYAGRLTPTMLCAGLPRLDGRDSCTEESGGPLVCRTEDSGFVVLGVTSWRDGCGLLQKPVVYSSVAVLRDWIVEQLDNASVGSEPEEDTDDTDYATESSGGTVWSSLPPKDEKEEKTWQMHRCQQFTAV